jgi:uncharacterized membrane protein
MPASGRPDVQALGLLLACGLCYTGINLYRLDHFYVLDYDLAIFAQGLHLLSHGETPFVGVRGMHLFGEHATYVHLLIAPLYALAGGPRLLVLLNSAALVAAGALLHRIAREELGVGAARVVLAAFLLHPGLQHTWLEYYQPVNLALPCLIGAWDAIRRGNERAALAWSALALVTMENLAATVFALGVFALLRRRRRLGIVLVAAPVAYVVLLLGVVFPALNPGGYVYGHRLYGDYASSLPEALAHLARPENLLSRVATAQNAEYLFGLFAPLAFLPALAPATLALAAQLPLNLVSSWPYAHEIRYHYVAPVLPFLALALIGALRRLQSRRPVALAAVAVGVALGQALFAPAWLLPRPGRSPWRGLAADRAERAGIEMLLQQIPADAAVAAHERFLPHLSRRRELYMLPKLGPEWPGAILVDLPRLSEGEAARVHAAVERGGFVEAARTVHGTVLLLPRSAPRPSAGPTISPPSARPAPGR